MLNRTEPVGWCVVDLALFFTVFATLFLVELPDKTFIATLVLATKYRPLYVWIGVATAFAVQTAIAVFFGSLISRLPTTPVHIVVAVLFLVAGILLIKGAKDAAEEGDETQHEFEDKAKPAEGAKAIGASFLILFLAEWGDLSQLATAGFVARNGHELSVGLGAFGALALVSGLGAFLGKKLLDHVSLTAIRTAGGVVCLIFAALMVASLCGVTFPSWVPA